MADHKATAAQLASIANAIRLKGGTSAALEYPSEWISAIQNLSPASGGSSIIPVDPTAEYKVTDTELAAIASAIRTRGETSALLEFPTEFVSAIEAISGGSSVDIVPWSTGTDEQIVSMIQAAHNGEIDLQTDGGWAVGDVRTITLDAVSSIGVDAQSVDLVISSFNQYYDTTCVMQFDFLNCLNKKDHISTTYRSYYKDSYMQNNFLPALVDGLPSWLKSHLMTFSTKNRLNSSTLHVIENCKLSLRSEKETKGTASKAWDDGSVYIPFYAQNSAIKKIQGSSQTYWLRSDSASSSDTQNICINESNTLIPGSKQNDNFGIAPFGCL